MTTGEDELASAGAADPVEVRALCDYLVHAFEDYCNAGAVTREIGYLDALMGIHNAHKAIVIDLAERVVAEGTLLRGGDPLRARCFVYKLAVDTFAEAMAVALRKAH